MPHRPGQVLAPPRPAPTGCDSLPDTSNGLRATAPPRDARERLRNTVASLNARAKISVRPATDPKKGLSTEQRERLLAVIVPSSPENPFRTDAVRYRNLALIACLDQTGMRRGELAGLKIRDIDVRQLTISIHRRPPDPKDPRKQRPHTKSNARKVPMKLELSDILFHYLTVVAARRARRAKARLSLRRPRGHEPGGAVEPEKHRQDLRFPPAGPRLRSPSPPAAPYLERQVLRRNRPQRAARPSDHPRPKKSVCATISWGGVPIRTWRNATRAGASSVPPTSS